MRGIVLFFLLLAGLVAHAQEATETDVQAQLDAALAQISNLESRLATEQTALSSLRVKFVQEVAAREAKIAELSATPVASSGIQERLNRSLIRNAALSARIRELEATAVPAEPLTASQDSTDLLSQRLAVEQKAVADLRVKLVQEVSAREEQLKVQQASYQALEQRLGVEQQALSALRVKYVQDIAALKNAPVTLAPNCSAQSKALNSLITSLSSQNASLRAAASAAASETPVAAPAIANAEQLKALNTLITSLSNQNASLRANARTAVSEAPVVAAASNSGQLKSLNTLITSLSNQNSSLRAQIRQLQSPSVVAPAQGYTIKAGDTLSSIALEIYGDADRWQDIAAVNNISDQGTITLEVGQTITIP